MRASGGVRAAGALGVAMKSFGLIDYLRSFSTTGSLIRMISVRSIMSALRVNCVLRAATSFLWSAADGKCEFR